MIITRNNENSNSKIRIIQNTNSKYNNSNDDGEDDDEYDDGDDNNDKDMRNDTDVNDIHYTVYENGNYFTKECLLGNEQLKRA